ncbi:hypothetical protein BT96DRAFT_1050921, partial [Gymnopus androsaceus JB14]
HTNDTPSTVVNTLVIIDTEKQVVTPLVSGADFYACPRFSPDGTKLLVRAFTFIEVCTTHCINNSITGCSRKEYKAIYHANRSMAAYPLGWRNGERLMEDIHEAYIIAAMV